MSQPLRILFVDDEETFLSSTCELLRREGYSCDGAADVPEALARLESNDYDLVIADIEMSGNDELQFIHQLATRDDSLPVILVTAYPSIASAVESVELPVVAYLVKPFEFDELLSKVRATARRVGALRGLRQELVRLQEYRDELTLTEEHMRQLPRAGQTPSLEAFVGMALRNVVESLANLRGALAEAQGNSPDAELKNWPKAIPPDMREVLHGVVGTLERTKGAFKSKELGELRRKLEGMLQA